MGGPENGECAFIKLGERELQVNGDPSPQQSSDVDSALPLDLDPPSWLSSPGTPSGDTTSASTRRLARRLWPEFELHKFGGSIVNSVTIHRFSGHGDGVSDEDVIVLRYYSMSTVVGSRTDHSTATTIELSPYIH